MKSVQHITKDTTVPTSQTNKRKVRHMTKYISKNNKDIAIRSTKRLTGESMIVQQIRYSLHKDG